MTNYNARIKDVTLGLEDHGIPTAYVTVEYDGGSVQGFGGYDLRPGSAMLNFVMGVQEAVGASDWSKLKGMYCRIGRPEHRIEAIGHIVEDRWFYTDDIYKS